MTNLKLVVYYIIYLQLTLIFVLGIIIYIGTYITNVNTYICTSTQLYIKPSI